MSRRALLLTLLTVCGIALVFYWIFQRPGDYANLPPSAAGPWVAFGDSLTSGYGASEGHDYPALLSQRLGIKIINLGQSGDTSTDGLRRLDDLLQFNPSVVLLCLGGNDGLQRLPQDAMTANVGLMIDRLHAQGAFVVLIGVRSATLRDRNAAAFKRLARQKRVFYVRDILRGIFPKPIYMADALHPNDAGYELIAERLEKELRPLLAKISAKPGIDAH